MHRIPRRLVSGHRRWIFSAAFFAVTALVAGAPALSRSFGLFAQSLHGKVVGIADGDTLTLLLPDHTQKRVRLAGIDAPESKQPYGQKSRQALAEMVFGKDVAVRVVDTDRYGRWVADVYAGAGHVNAEMVRGGYAWVYREFARDPKLFAAEEEARSARRGIWGLPGAERMPPWEWRKLKRSLKR